MVLIIENDAQRYEAIAVSVIQRLEKAFMISPRALVVVKDKEQALQMEAVLKI